MIEGNADVWGYTFLGAYIWMENLTDTEMTNGVRGKYSHVKAVF